MANPKERHYWTQLRAALTSGLWDSDYPGKEPNNTPLKWSELLRKFNKHCSGCSDVAELASQTQALSLLLAANASDQSLDGNDIPPKGPLHLDEECILSEERVAEGMTGFTALQAINSSNTESIRLAVAYYSYALGKPAECLSLLTQSKDLTDVQSYIPGPERTRSGSLTLAVPNGSATSSSSSWTGSFSTTVSVAPSPDVGDGRAWATTECIRSICLQGMSHERISPSEPELALNAYLTALPLMKVVTSDIACTIPTKSTSGGGDPGSFVRYRELWRWVERLLRRAIIIAARTIDLTSTDEQTSIWPLFDYYRACSAHWPPTFRSEHRSTVLVLQLRALILRSRSYNTPALKAKAPRWVSSARSVIQEYRNILTVSSRFPKAGERNTKVEDFVDLCVAVWEADGAIGEYAGWVIDVLWWATRLTFNSYRVFRHMTRLLYVSGDPELAKRLLRLYVQVVSKAREASLAEADDAQEGPFGVGGDYDTDRNWVLTLVHGARMLCRTSLLEADYGKALDETKEAGVLLEKARSRLDKDDKELNAVVELAEGIWSSTMAHAEQDPDTRTSRLAFSLQKLQSAVETYPTPSIHHHLALALARPGPSQDLQEAIVHARSAVEEDASEVRHWHLLGLLLAATGDWRAAKGVLEFGIDAAEAELTDPESDSQPNSEHPNSNPNNNLSIRDFATVNSTSAPHVNGNGGPAVNGHSTEVPEPVGPILSVEDTTIPPSSQLLQLSVDHPNSSRHERFEHALQTRMTLLALTEHVEGAEGVGDKWLEVFQWFREKWGVNADDRRRSIDSRRVSEDRAPSEMVSMQLPPPTVLVPQSVDETNTIHESQTTELPTPIPITVTPASPGINGPDFPQAVSLQDQLSSPLENGSSEKRSTSLDEKDRDVSRGKKVKDALKTVSHKGQARIHTISKKIGHGVGRRPSLTLKRTSSAPDFHYALSQSAYQASSIHLRQYQSIHASHQDLATLEVPPPPPSPSPTISEGQKRNQRAAKDSRLLSDLWLMSAAIFRRLGKIEQARGAIQEAEVRDEDNPSVWVQLGLYYSALNDHRKAIESFQKSLFLFPDHIAATIHLCSLYLSPATNPIESSKEPDRANVDLAAGLLSDLTKGQGWDVPEAWYFLAKAYKSQGRRDRERECLSFALSLSETRGVRDIGTALGWCL